MKVIPDVTFIQKATTCSRTAACSRTSPSGSNAELTGSVKTVATTAALPGTSLVTVPRVAKAEAAVDGTEAVAAGAVEEDAAAKVVAGTTLRRPRTPATGKLRLPKEATAASIKKSRELSGASTGGVFSASLQRRLQETCPGAERGCFCSVQAPGLIQSSHHL